MSLDIYQAIRNRLPSVPKTSVAKMSVLSRLKKDRSASVGLIFGVSLVAVVPAVGVAVDMGRAVHFKTALQNAADNAALAGATVFTTKNVSQTTVQNTALNFMNQAIAALPTSSNVTAPSVTIAGSNSSYYTVQVSTTRAITTTFLSPVMSTMKVSVTATAKIPMVNNISIGGGSGSSNLAPVKTSSDAGDNNIIYAYAIPLDNSIPKPEDLHLLYNNDPKQAASNPTGPVKFSVAANQNIGFALMNKTGALSGYGTNGYGGKQGSVHWMYSHLNPPSSQAYPSVTQNCLIETSDMTKTPTSTAAAPNTGSCFSTTPGTYTQNLALDCTKNAGKVIRYYWNDMGGTKDDHDYNDMAYTVQCPSTTSTATSSPDAGTGAVVLIK